LFSVASLNTAHFPAESNIEQNSKSIYKICFLIEHSWLLLIQISFM
jgi:hypothetical protein